MIYCWKRKKYILMNSLKTKSLKLSSHKKFNLLINQCKFFMHIGRQFYQYSKIIMKTYSEHFLSESDHQDIDKMVTKDKKMHSHKQNNTQINNFGSNLQIITPETISKQNKIQETNDFKPQKHLGSNMQNKKKLILKIVTLYHNFFQEQKSSAKAEQIMHIYKKKLCDQGIIVPTLFCWLNDWICKEFSLFIKSQISFLSHKNNSKLKKYQKNSQIKANKIQIKGKASKFIGQQINLQSEVYQSPNRKKERNAKKQVNLDMFFSIDMSSGKSKQELYEKISMIKKKSIQQTNESQIFQNYKSKQNISGPRQQVLLTITGESQNNEKQRSKQSFKDNRRLSINSYDTSNLITIKQQQLQVIVKKQIVNDEFDAPINRQILIGAFYDKYFNLYKSLQQVLPDLDIQYVKQIKRNDRKVEVKKRIKQISRILLRNQQSIKNTVQKYELQYFQRKNKQQKRMKKKKRNLKSINNQSIINDPETQIRTAYHSLQVTDREIHMKITSQKKINSNLLMRRQIQQSSNLQRIYHQKKQRPKQTYELNKPIRFEFNLPRLPQKQRNVQSKLKQQSKIVLIQSGRYKLLDTLDSNEVIQMGNRKSKLSNYSVDISSLKYDSPVLERQSYSTKRNSALDKRSVSIFQIITKKNKNYQSNDKQTHNKKRKSVQTQQITPQIIRQSRRRYRKNKNIQDNQQTRKQFKQIIQSLQTYDYDLISGWEKGQQTPIIKEDQTPIIN